MQPTFDTDVVSGTNEIARLLLWQVCHSESLFLLPHLLQKLAEQGLNKSVWKWSNKCFGLLAIIGSIVYLIATVMRLLSYMQQLVNNNSQFIISTHSPILMTFPNAEILEITEDGINSVDYKETEHFLITKRFMDAPEKMIENLLD